MDITKIYHYYVVIQFFLHCISGTGDSLRMLASKNLMVTGHGT